MNKNELIEKAVVDLGGKWKYPFNNLCTPNEKNTAYAPYSKFDSIRNVSELGSSWIFVCTREEFNAAADRMRGKPDWKDAPEWAQWLAQDSDGHWFWFRVQPSVSNVGEEFTTTKQHTRARRGSCIGDWRNTLEKRPEQKADPLNGYKFGVEYQADGKKPNLPDDVVLGIFTVRILEWQESKVCDCIWDAKANPITAFKITDSRYRPAAPEQAEPTPAKPWFEAGELPPAGTFVDVVGFVVYGIGEKNCEVIAHVENCAVIRMSYGLGCFQAECLKPSMTDKEKAIEAAITTMQPNALTGTMAIWFGRLYDVGLLRLPDQK